MSTTYSILVLSRAGYRLLSLITDSHRYCATQ